ncbi:MAG: SH3 domain-containing protein [Saprospiraceae bacterium]|jgi:hypothetical protein|nr:SH3 domain-containing protein [Lewinellaceae bacterium]
MRILFFLLFLFPNPAMPQSPLWSDNLEVTASALKLREAPRLDAAVLSVLPQGAAVENLSRQDQPPVWDVIDGKSAYWVRVGYQGQTGYAFGAYLKADFYLFYENTIVAELPNVKNWYALYKTPEGDELRKTTVFTKLDSVEITGGLEPILHAGATGSTFVIGTDRELKTGIVGDYYLRHDQWGEEIDFHYELNPGANVLLTSFHAPLRHSDHFVAVLGTGSYELSTGLLEKRDLKIWAALKSESGNNFLTKQDLSAFFNPRDESALLKWWGDLDGDGKPDVLIGRCAFGEGGCTDYLFLSSNARTGELLRLAAAYYWGMGC